MRRVGHNRRDPGINQPGNIDGSQPSCQIVSIPGGVAHEAGTWAVLTSGPAGNLIAAVRDVMKDARHSRGQTVKSRIRVTLDRVRLLIDQCHDAGKGRRIEGSSSDNVQAVVASSKSIDAASQ